MKPPKPLKRSTSPFGMIEPEPGPYDELKTRLHQTLKSKSKEESKLESSEDVVFIADFLEAAHFAPGNNLIALEKLCSFIPGQLALLREKELYDDVYAGLINLFFRKIEVFLIDHHNQESCEKMGWDKEYRDDVLFAKERDMLVGRLFGPLNDKEPKKFGEFIDQWKLSTSPDHLLHFMDFCAGAKNPTLEHHLVFAQPSLMDISKDKSFFNGVLDKAGTILERLKSQTWEKDTKASLGLL